VGYFIAMLFAAASAGILAQAADKDLFWIGLFLAAAVVTILKLSHELKGLRRRVLQLENKQEKPAQPAAPARAKTAPARVPVTPATAASVQAKRAAPTPRSSVTSKPGASALASRLSEMRGDWNQGTPTATPASVPAPAATAPPLAAPLEAGPLEAAPLEAAPLEAAPLVEPAAGRMSGLPGAIRALLERTNFSALAGLVALFFGVGFLLRYVAEHGVLPAEAWLFGVVLGGALLHFFGNRLASSQANYALLLQGSAVGVWYLASFAAFRVYGLTGPGTTLAILVGLSGFTAWRAVVQNGKPLAIFAALGGIFAPILAGFGEGNHIALFACYSVINVGIVAIAQRQSWAVLPLLGFVCTFIIGSIWGQTSYRPEFFPTVQPFLLLSVLFYFCVPLLFASQNRSDRIPIYSSIIVFGMPATVLVLQARLVADVPFGAAWSALLMGAVYLTGVLVLRRQLKRLSLLLRDAYLGIGIVLVAISLPLALDERVAAALWALGAAGGVWLAIKQKRMWNCFLAVAILVGSGLLWLAGDGSAGQTLFLNLGTLQAGTISIASLFAAWVLASRPAHIPVKLPQGVAVWGALWWLAIGLWQINAHLEADYRTAAVAAYFICSALLGWVISLKLPRQRI
jgi:uncharacterized membrane protein